MAADEFPLPHEYRFFRFDGLQSELPEDLDERTIVFLDCGNIDRNPAEAFKGDDARILNLDHHHDNTRFGTVNHVVEDASCTAEIVWDLMCALGVTPTIEIAEALYVGLVTDTGKFMYENTGPRAHIMAAELIAAGIDVHRIYRRLYEDMPYPKLELLGRALANLQRLDDGAVTFSYLTRDDFRLANAVESYSEGIIDHLRAVAGTKVAALARELDGGDGRKKVSLRSTDGEVDVSAIARAGGGGGHRRAAGFSTELSHDELVAFLREQVAAQL
jgi:phosphoesterase RecJ-like protein